MNAVLLGLLAALVTELPRILRHAFPSFTWGSPFWIFPVMALIFWAERRMKKTKKGDPRFGGLSDLLVHIHTPRHPDSSERWLTRGAISFLLNLFGMGSGSSGAAVEVSHGALLAERRTSARWFEQKRRTGAAMALAAGISAAFGAPFAAVILPLELGIGGRVQDIALTSISAYLGVEFLTYLGTRGLAVIGQWHSDRFDLGGVLANLKLDSPQQWAALLLLSLLSGLMGTTLTYFFSFVHRSLDSFSKVRWMKKIWITGAIVFGILWVLPELQVPSATLLEQILWGKRSTAEVFFLMVSLSLVIAVISAGWGTTGVFWPLFVIGGAFSYWTRQMLVPGIEGIAGVGGLCGATAFWGAVFGAPLSAALIAYEITDRVQIVLPCLIAGLLGRELRLWIGAQTWLETDLEFRGIRLLEGRSSQILDALKVRDAMVLDHETISEMLAVAGLREKIRQSKYPFFPVVNSIGNYTGFVTIDRIQEVVESADRGGLIEIKDLLYQDSKVVRAVHVDDPLSVTAGLFEDIPCIPVLESDGRVAGLLFVHAVRVAYDREVARRSFSK